MPLVTSGVETGSLRQLALQRMADLGLVCRDIRTREVGFKIFHKKDPTIKSRVDSSETIQQMVAGKHS